MYLPNLQSLHISRFICNPFIFHVLSALAALAHMSHILSYAPHDSRACRLAKTRNLLGLLSETETKTETETEIETETETETEK